MGQGETDSEFATEVCPHHRQRSLSQPPSRQVPHSSFQEGRHTGLVDQTTNTFWCNTFEGRASLVCKQHKSTPSFLLDNILKENGHDCLRLPAYHADLNSIELIWATIKGYIARRNVSFKMMDVIQLTHDAIAAVTEDDWVSSCRHVEEMERKYLDAGRHRSGSRDGEDSYQKYYSKNI